MGDGGTTTSGTGGRGGGAIFAYAGAELTVTGTEFNGNGAFGGEGAVGGPRQGRRIFVHDGARVTASGLQFSDDSAGNGGGGTFGEGDYSRAVDNQDVYGTLRSLEDSLGTIDGTEANDHLRGTRGDDRIYGGQGGDDTLVGGRRDDLLTGAWGRDTFVFGSGDGADIVTDFAGLTPSPSEALAAEADVLVFKGQGLTACDMRIAHDGYDTVITFAGHEDLRVSRFLAKSPTRNST